MATSEEHTWGRVGDHGAVFVREGDEWREVGQFPDGTPEEALAYFERKYVDLAGQVTLLEQRAKRGAPAHEVAKAVTKLQQSVVGANAVGDLAKLTARLEALTTTVDALNEQQAELNQAALAEAVAIRTTVVEQAEKLAAQDPEKTQWKSTTEQMNALFVEWQSHQQDGPKLPKATANELWKRFRTARTTIEQRRRSFYADLDAAHRDVRARKQELIERAEALVERGADGIPGYRSLLEDWKQSGRAGKKQDDALWARFKAAGDALYSAKSEIDALDNAEYQANLEKKQALLAEATPLLAEKDREKVRRALLTIQQRWDEVGKVPRDQLRSTEDGLRLVEQHLRSLDDTFWKANNPETKARSAGLASQLNAAIDKLQAELTAAEKTGDARKIAAATEALDARKQWLNALDA